jgi:FlaA1/EpsC-like NDP-sugar epimerase
MNLLFERNIPRLIIFLADSFICLLSLFIAYLLRFNFTIPATENSTFNYVFPFMLAVRLSSFLLFKTYAGIIRYTGTRDTMRILLTLSTGSVFTILANLVSYQFTQHYIVPFSILIIESVRSV